MHTQVKRSTETEKAFGSGGELQALVSDGVPRELASPCFLAREVGLCACVCVPVSVHKHVHTHMQICWDLL